MGGGLFSSHSFFIQTPDARVALDSLGGQRLPFYRSLPAHVASQRRSALIVYV